MSGLEKYLLLAVLCLLFPVGAMIAAWMVRPKPKATPGKLDPYECGVNTVGPTWTRFTINYFKYALLFVLFDVETLFLYPWAVRFHALGWFAFAEMIVFVGILALGLWYAWKEGALEWE